MARRKETLLETLSFFPWYVSLSLAVLVFLLAKYGAPWYFAGNSYLSPVGEAFANVAWIFTIPFLIGAAASAYRASIDRKIYTQQKNIDTIRKLSWREFERLMGEAFRRQGYSVVDTGPGPDGGYDLVLRKDGLKYYVQCKHWKSRQIGVTVVRELFGVMASRQIDGGFVVTSGEFTDDARAFAETVNLELIDGKSLIHLLPHLGINDEPSNDPHTERICQKCGHRMVLRKARKGPNAGNQFWGCTAFPQCQFTENP